MKFIPVAEPSIGTLEKQYVLKCLKSTWISSSGEFIDAFEHKFAKRFGTKYAVTTSNGTAALHLALLALGIKSEDEVLVPALTFVATANVVLYMGARPVFVDIDHKTWNIDPEKIEKKITKKTRAIIPVHLYGYPADMNTIMRIAKKHRLFVIEDAAEAHGAKIGKKMVGSIGDIGCFSFYGNKVITTGEGGMIITNKKRIEQKIRLLKNHGMSPQKKYYHPILGFNYRMTNLQAAVGLAQLENMQQILKKRASLEKTYRKLLQNIPGLIFQPVEKSIEPICWLFSIRITKQFGKSRDALMAFLKSKNIDTRPFFHPLPNLPMYKTRRKFPVAQKIAQEGISLPSSPNLTAKQVNYIAKAIHEFCKK